MNLIDHFDRGARISPDRPAFIFEGARTTYRAARDQNCRIANALRARGIGLGSKCAVISDNNPLAFNAVLGILRAGGIWVPCNARNAVHAHCDFLGLTECEVLFFSKAYEPLIDEIAARVPSLRLLVCLDGDSPHGPGLGVLTKGAGTDPIALPWDDERIQVIGGTGGTTGKSKGVMIPCRVWDCFIANMLATLPFDRDSVYLAAAPMTHAAGAYAFPVLTLGGTILFHDGVDPQLFLSDIAKYKVTETFLPPTATLAILAQPNIGEVDFSSLRAFISTGAPMAPDRAAELFRVMGPVWYQLYGQVEAVGIMTVLNPADCLGPDGRPLAARFETVGRATPFARVAIMGADGTILPAGEKGEIVCQSALVMAGYYENPEATAEVSTHGWHHTGDVGTLDQDGFLRILDRTKDMIITGGLNVFPSEIENWLMQHPAVHEVAVIGVPDDKWGEAVKAVVQLKAGMSVGADALIAWCKEELGGVKTPKTVDFVEIMPKSPVGKLLKKELRATYWEQAGRQI
ncbi:MAG: class I adenylate-forming enzyme family protein [Paracoccus sp. (in: a-proteobacteria)]